VQEQPHWFLYCRMNLFSMASAGSMKRTPSAFSKLFLALEESGSRPLVPHSPFLGGGGSGGAVLDNKLLLTDPFSPRRPLVRFFRGRFGEKSASVLQLRSMEELAWAGSTNLVSFRIPGSFTVLFQTGSFESFTVLFQTGSLDSFIVFFQTGSFESFTVLFQTGSLESFIVFFQTGSLDSFIVFFQTGSLNSFTGSTVLIQTGSMHNRAILHGLSEFEYMAPG